MLILDKNSQFSYSQWHEAVMQEGGAVLINKPTSWTSFDVVAKLRNITKVKKIGHCGTLDPFAEGLLILCLGKATKSITTFQDLPKQYIATVKLGAITKTLDPESEEENILPIGHITNSDINNIVNSFIGEIEQVPPMFSAKKIKGKKLYELARKNIELEIPPATINIYEIKILDIELPFVKLKINCSKGTYIRSLARDIGEKLKVGAYLTNLVRTKIGDYESKNALTIHDFLELKDKSSI